MQLTINKETFQITETENGYNIKQVSSSVDLDVRQGELNESIYRLMESLGI